MPLSVPLPPSADAPRRILTHWAADWWHTIHFGALAFATALSPSAYDRASREAAARQICLIAWRVLPGFAIISALFSIVLIRIVVVTAESYGLSQFALETVVHVLVVELIPLAAALFVALRSGVQINAELSAMLLRGDFVALRKAGVDPLRLVLMPRIIGSALAVITLAAVSGITALLLTYLGVYGLSPWALAAYTHNVGEIFDPQLTWGLGLKTLLFALAVAVIPVAAGIHERMATSEALRGLVRLFLVLIAIEGASLAVKFI